MIRSFLLLALHLEWVSGYQTNAFCGPSWLTECSSVPDEWNIMNGAYDTVIDTPPAVIPAGRTGENYIVLGGVNVDEGNVPTASDIVDLMKAANCHGVNFDTEGVFSDFALANQLAQEIRAIDSTIKLQATVLNGQLDDAATYQDSFDFIGIMAYGQKMTGEGWGITRGDITSGGTYAVFQNFKGKIPATKLLLGMTAAGLEPYMVNAYKKWIAEEEFAGMFVWKFKNLGLVDDIPIECLEDPSVECQESPSPPGPSPSPPGPSPTPPGPSPAPPSEFNCDPSQSFTIGPGDICYDFWKTCNDPGLSLCCAGEGRTCYGGIYGLRSGDVCSADPDGSACPKSVSQANVRVSLQQFRRLVKKEKKGKKGESVDELCQFVGQSAISKSSDAIASVKPFFGISSAEYSIVGDCVVELAFAVSFYDSRYDTDMASLVKELLEDDPYLEHLQSSGLSGADAITGVLVEDISKGPKGGKKKSTGKKGQSEKDGKSKKS